MFPEPLFHDRHDAGEQLANVIQAELISLDQCWHDTPCIVYALPKGGLPVAEPISQRLGCPMDIMVAKKVTRPDNPELAIGAVTADGHVLRSRQAELTQATGLWGVALKQAHTMAKAQLAEFAPYRPEVSPTGAIAILVDDGIATGMTMAVAARALRSQRPGLIFVCAPVAPQAILESLHHWGDRVIVLSAPERFLSVSRFYETFPQVEMPEALEYLSHSNNPKSKI
jgi:predicted phosphoribosyltransferase